MQQKTTARLFCFIQGEELYKYLAEALDTIRTSILGSNSTTTDVMLYTDRIATHVIKVPLGNKGPLLVATPYGRCTIPDVLGDDSFNVQVGVWIKIDVYTCTVFLSMPD